MIATVRSRHRLLRFGRMSGGCVATSSRRVHGGRSPPPSSDWTTGEAFPCCRAIAEWPEGWPSCRGSSAGRGGRYYVGLLRELEQTFSGTDRRRRRVYIAYYREQVKGHELSRPATRSVAPENDGMETAGHVKPMSSSGEAPGRPSSLAKSRPSTQFTSSSNSTSIWIAGRLTNNVTSPRGCSHGRKSRASGDDAALIVIAYTDRCSRARRAAL